MFCRKFLSVVVGLSVVCGMSFARAEEAQETSDSAEREEYALDEMVVTAGRVEELASDVTADVQVIDSADLERSGADDLGELMAEEGVGHIQQYPGALTSVGIRGFRTDSHGNDLNSRVLVLMDGRRAGTGNLAKIMTENIERVEVIRGPASVQYGSAAMGGVINVITREGEGRPSPSVKGRYGSSDTAEGTLGVSGELGGLDFSGSFTREKAGDYDTGSGDEYKNTGFDRKDYSSLNVGYEFAPNNRIGVIYSRYDGSDIGDPGYFSQVDKNAEKDSMNWTADLIYSGETEDGLVSWKGRYFTGKDEDEWRPEYSKNKVDREGAQLQLSYRPEHSLLTAGLDWVNYEKESTMQPEKSEYDNPAAFLMGRRHLLDDRLTLSGGLRYDWYRVDVKRGQGGSERDDNLSTNAGAAYRLTDSLRVRANYGEAFKMPTAQELAADFTSSYSGGGMTFTDRYVGNSDLDPESSRTYEIGADWDPGYLSSSLTGFYTAYDDKIETATTAGGDQTWENLGDATIQGIEGRADYRLGSQLEWDSEFKPYVSAVYLPVMRDHEKHRDLLYTSDFRASWGVEVDGIYGAGAKLDFTYSGPQDVRNWETGTGEIVEKGGFTVTNLSLWKTFFETEDNDGLRLKLDVRNLLDRDYSYVKGYPMPGRSVFLSASYSF
ncbi:MAG: TonB-dependent receptor plug domain-containing protein [Planctomycetota bacterium]